MNLDRISIDPAVMNGQPCVRGTRYRDREEIAKDYPRLDEEDTRQVLHYAAVRLEEDHR